MKLQITQALTMGACILWGTHAIADPVLGVGTFAGAGTAGNCPSYCTGGEFSDVGYGGEGIFVAQATDEVYGTARAWAGYVGGLGLPQLKAYGSSGFYRRGSGYAYATQGYTYGGSSPTSRHLEFTLTGDTQNNPNGYSYSRVHASVAVIVAPMMPWVSSFGSEVFEVGIAYATYVAYDEVSIGGTGSGAQGAIEFPLLPGETFFIVAELDALAQNGVADAWHTLNTSFDNAQQLTPFATGDVPVPTTAALVALGLAVTAMRGRRQRRMAQGAVAA